MDAPLSFITLSYKLRALLKCFDNQLSLFATPSSSCLLLKILVSHNFVAFQIHLVAYYPSKLPSFAQSCHISKNQAPLNTISHALPKALLLSKLSFKINPHVMTPKCA
jgi:hypothetical protein